MGCGLRKIEDPDDSSPGKIFSTLKRPHVETKTDSAYEYTLLDFTLEASSNSSVIRIKSLLDIPSKVEEYYMRGYVAAAVHPIILSTGRRKHLPVSYLYRVVLYRLTLSQKHTASSGERHSTLVIEEWTSMCETLTHESMKTLLEKLLTCDGTDNIPDTKGLEQDSRKHAANENYKNWTERTLSGQSSESGIDEEINLDNEPMRDQLFQFCGGGTLPKSRKNPGKTLYAVFNVLENDSTCCKYVEGSMSMKVTRKGATISTMEADWLELTTFYYKQGLSLIDSFVFWETVKGDQLPKLLEGLFIYEEEGSRVPGSNKKGNDAIIVEQWTVFEDSEIKMDYGPLLHTLAEFGWLLTCVLPTPIIRYNSEGNLATKQIVFLQRPILSNSTIQSSETKSQKQVGNEEKSKIANINIGLDTTSPRSSEMGQSSDEFCLSSSKQGWAKDGHQQFGSFSGFSSSDNMLRELDDVQFDQEDGVTQVTCM
ncbi:hypothetical protein FKM82_015885 [Ascaphus truei]